MIHIIPGPTQPRNQDSTAHITRVEYRRSSPALLRPPVADRFTRTCVWRPIAVYLPTAVLLIILGARAAGLPRTAMLLPVGYLAWTLTEYWLHRTVFHWEATPGTFAARVHWLIHGVHHEHPDDPERVMMPLAGSVPLAFLFAAAFRLAWGPVLWMSFTGAFLAGYLAYDVLHYWLHHRRPTSRFGRELRRRHLLHHFHDSRTGYAVSAPWLDHLFNTAPRPSSRNANTARAN